MTCSCGNTYCEHVQDDDLHLCCQCAPDGVYCQRCIESLETYVLWDDDK